MLQHEFLRLGKLRDHAQPRSTLRPTGLSRRCGSHDGRTHNRAHRLPLGRRRRPKKRKSHQKQMQHLRKVSTRTHLSILPVEAALRFRVFLESTAGLSTARSWTSDAVRLADGPAYQKQPSSVEDPTTRTRKRAKEKEVRFTLELVCIRGTSSGNGGLL